MLFFLEINDDLVWTFDQTRVYFIILSEIHYMEMWIWGTICSFVWCSENMNFFGHRKLWAEMTGTNCELSSLSTCPPLLGRWSLGEPPRTSLPPSSHTSVEDWSQRSHNTELPPTWSLVSWSPTLTFSETCLRPSSLLSSRYEQTCCQHSWLFHLFNILLSEIFGPKIHGHVELDKDISWHYICTEITSETWERDYDMCSTHIPTPANLRTSIQVLDLCIIFSYIPLLW